MFSRGARVRRGIGRRIRDRRRSEQTQPGRAPHTEAGPWSRTCALRPAPSGRARTAEEAKSQYKRIRWTTPYFSRKSPRAPHLFPGMPNVRLHRAWHREAHLPRGRLGMHHALPSTPPWWSRNTLATHVRATRQSRKVLQSPVLRVALVFSADDSLSFRFPRTCACARCFDVLAVSCYFLLRCARFFVYVFLFAEYP